MADSYVFSLPSISSATLSPNPVNINSSLSITVVATDSTVTLYAEDKYSGEFYGGEI